MTDHMITPDSEYWPKRVNDLTDPPRQLYVRGKVSDLPVLLEDSVSIIGSRVSTAYGDRMATDLAQELANREWTVVSGGAFGIDAAAHRGALAAGGRTIVVLAGGVDVAFPPSHRALFERIVDQGGLLVSEYAPGTLPERERFLARNRIIAALTPGMVLVEAGRRSGARNAFGHARWLGRVLMAVPGPVTSIHSGGVLDEMRTGGVTPVGNVHHVIEELVN